MVSTVDPCAVETSPESKIHKVWPGGWVRGCWPGDSVYEGQLRFWGCGRQPGAWILAFLSGAALRHWALAEQAGSVGCMDGVQGEAVRSCLILGFVRMWLLVGSKVKSYRSLSFPLAEESSVYSMLLGDEGEVM